MTTGNEGQVTILVRLPDEYDTAGRFPLFVYLGGGHGGPGMDIGMPNRLGGTHRSITANFPLFKREPPDPEVFRTIGVDTADYPVIAEAYRVILNRLRQVIPNIDPTTSILGGHSNGAKTTAALLSMLDENILHSFQGFFFVDGGFQWTSVGDTEVLGKKHLLFLVGEGNDQPEWWREQMVGRVRFFEECAQRFDVERWRFHFAEGVGHEFAPEYFPIIQEWAEQVEK